MLNYLRTLLESGSTFTIRFAGQRTERGVHFVDEVGIVYEGVEERGEDGSIRCAPWTQATTFAVTITEDRRNG